MPNDAYLKVLSRIADSLVRIADSLDELTLGANPQDTAVSEEIRLLREVYERANDRKERE